MKTNAIVIEKGKKIEFRCGKCGKLLCLSDNNYLNNVDKTKQSVKIIVRCSRNNCKTDNTISL